MAILSGPPSPQKAPSLTGKVYVSTYRGQVVLRKWPTRKTRPLNPITAQQAERFRQAGILVRYLAPEQQIVAREATKGTPIYPRDALMMAMTGTLYGLVFEDGRKLYSVATRQGVSESLDALSQQPRSLIVRAGELWVPVETTKSGLVPISQDDDPFVAWGEIPGPAGSGSKVLATQSAPVSGKLNITGLSFANSGMIQVRLDNITVNTSATHLQIQLYLDGVLQNSLYAFEAQYRDSNAGVTNTNQASVANFPLSGFGASIRVSSGPLCNFGAIITIPTLANSTHIMMHSQSVYQSENGAIGNYQVAGGVKATGNITGFDVHGLENTLATGKMTIIHLD